MTRSVAEIAADFDALTTADFDFAPGTSGWERTRCALRRNASGERSCGVRTVMFHTMERLDGVDLGTPGPLVHTLESWRGGYEEMLRAIRSSEADTPFRVDGQPDPECPLAECETWMELLRSVADNCRVGGNQGRGQSVHHISERKRRSARLTPARVHA